MDDLDAYQDKFSESGKRILEFALNDTQNRQQHFILPEHLLFALIIKENDLFNSTMKSLSMESETVRLAVEKRLKYSPQHIGHGFRISPDATEIFKFSMDRVRSQGRRVIEAEDIIAVFTTVKKDLLDDILQNPESPIKVFKRNQFNPNYLQIPQQPKSPYQIEFEAKQLESWRKFHNEQNKFLSQISLEDIVKKNEVLLGLTTLGGGGGSGGGGGIIGDEINYSRNSSLSFAYKLENDKDFNQAKIITTLKNDIENCLKQNHLKITKLDYSSPSSQYLRQLRGKMSNFCLMDTPEFAQFLFYFLNCLFH